MDKATFDKGLQIRKDTLGAEFVENAFKSADDFNRPMQELVTEYCWGYVWGRETLSRKTRSMLNLAMISALNRPHELKMHVKGALVNGVTRDEIPRSSCRSRSIAGCPPASIPSASPGRRLPSWTRRKMLSRATPNPLSRTDSQPGSWTRDSSW